MKIAFDVDDVLADLLTAWLESYNKEHGTNWKPENLTQWSFQNDLGCTYDDLLKHLLPSLYKVIQPYPEALKVVNQCRELGWEIVYISSCHDAPTWAAKVKWLVENGFLGVNDLAFPVGSWTTYKSKAEIGAVYNIDVLVDDHIGNCEPWPRIAYLMTRPHNQRLIWPGKRLKKLEDLPMELAWFPRDFQVADPNGLKEIIDLPKEFAGLVANNAGWIGDNDITKLKTGEKPSNPKDIIGSDKMPFHLFPNVALIHGTLAMLEGALKYGRSNFDEVGVKATIYIDAAERHWKAYKAGQDRASDSGLKHLGHAIACAAILLNAEAQGNLVDDRDYKGEAYLKEIEKETSEVKRLKEKYKDKAPKHYTIQDRKDLVDKE